MSLYKRGEVWWIALRHRGRRVRRSTGTSDKQAAKRQHDELKARLWQEKRSGRQLADALLLWTKAKDRSRRELITLRQIRSAYKDRPLIDVTEPSLIETFGDKGPGTYNKLVGIIRAALKMAAKTGWIETAPSIERRKEPPGIVCFLNADEWKALYAELPDHLQPMAAFSVATGLRWSNVSRLTWDRVSLQRKMVWIDAPDAKGRRGIGIPLSKSALAVLRRMDGREGFVFTYRGKPISSPKTAWGKATKRAGLEGFRWHYLRHSFASWHAMAGTPMEVLQQLGAWRDPKMVQRYAHLAPSYVARFADNAKPVKPERPQRRYTVDG